MPSGFALPNNVVNGRLRTESGADQLRKIIMIAVGPSSSSNPFNGAGTDIRLYDGPPDEVAIRIEDQISKQFKRLQEARRARLIRARATPGDGRVDVEVVYTNLESGENATYSTAISLGE